MLERIVLSAALALSLAGNGWQWWHAWSRYQDGRQYERQLWQGVIEDRNRQIEALAGAWTELNEESERLRAEAVARAGGVVLPVLSADQVRLCSLPEAVRVELNLIRATRRGR